ncbi:hypothetical protein IFM89_029667 [Coptis chinensis]|uniref:Protein DEFECTIVE IN MERISTEM SILENCING 3 n=1 Tax=Coptis chinensis TaxID=261450 RepID=A0A835IH12_9MAGN|nr:hypothetical protein IFM89_029667 [Coptis chinensis]
MFQPNPQIAGHVNVLPFQESSIPKPLDRSEHRATPVGSEMQNGGLLKVEAISDHSQIYNDQMKKLGLRIKHHEDNLKFLKNQMDNLDESILDMQVNLGKYHSSSVAVVKSENVNHSQTEENTIEHILQQEKSAAGVLCQLKIRHGTHASQLPFTKDVLGIVATLGKVDDDNLSRPYVGEFVADDPQRKLALLKPRLPSGECPAGFLGFAVNMITLESTNLSYLMPSGHGLRETLFYNLFSRLQVYNTRRDMLSALPCISDGALSLDGGMIKTSGIFSLGNRNEVEVVFPRSSGMSSLPINYLETEERIKMMKWEKERIAEDIQREEALLNHASKNFKCQKEECLKFIAQSSGYINQDCRLKKLRTVFIPTYSVKELSPEEDCILLLEKWILCHRTLRAVNSICLAGKMHRSYSDYGNLRPVLQMGM